MNSQNKRRLLWDACYNTRDLGGYTTKLNSQTPWQTFVRADNLIRLSADGQKALIDYGVTTIIDLRSPYELDMAESPFAPTSGQIGFPAYLHLSLLDESNTAVIETINQMHSLTETYYLIVDTFQENIALIMRAIANASKGAILFHCHSGRDRTGMIAAFLLSLIGVDTQTIANDYAISNSYLQPIWSKALTEQPEIMLDLLAYLDKKYGGVESYLLQSGVSKQDLTRIRAILI